MASTNTLVDAIAAALLQSKFCEFKLSTKICVFRSQISSGLLMSHYIE